MKRRVLAAVLSLALALGALTHGVLAAESETPSPGETDVSASTAETPESPEEPETPETPESPGPPEEESAPESSGTPEGEPAPEVPEVPEEESGPAPEDRASPRAAGQGVISGSAIRWELSSGTLTLSGKGPMPKDALYTPPWDASGVLYLVVEEGVTTISPYAFKYCKTLRTASLPEGLESIGSEAFNGCADLTRADLPSTLRELGGFAFARCPRLTRVVIPGSCAVVGGKAFSECAGLTELTLSEGVEVLEAGAFSYCTALKSVTVPSTVRDARGFMNDGGTFSHCTGLETAVIREGASGLGKSMFWYCTSLKSVSVPSTAEVTDTMFWDCKSLTDVDIAEGVTSVGNNAFYGCIALEAVRLPDSLEVLGEWAFKNCLSLREIAVPGGVTSIEDETFYNCDSLERFSLGEAPWRETQSIGRSAFLGCEQLNHVSFWYSLKTVRDKAFGGCTSLLTADFHGSSDEWDELIAYLGQDNGSLAAVEVSLLPVPTARPALLDGNGKEIRTLEDAAGRTLEFALDFHGDGGESAAWTMAACYDGDGRMIGLVRLEADASRVQNCARGELEVPQGTAEIKFLLTDGDSGPLVSSRSLLRGRTGLT